jgi:spore germination protein
VFLHIVKDGDTLMNIAKQYRVSLQRIVDDNMLANPNQLVVGQSLLIRPDNLKYVVEPGDTLNKIANRFGITVEQILTFNSQITDINNLKVGEEIQIVFDNIDKTPMEINGFTYININRNVLVKTLPYLTYLSIFSYPVKADGSLPELNDEPLIKEAYHYNVAPIMVVTNMDKPGSFSSDLGHMILSNEMVQDNLLNNIYRLIIAKGYQGVNFDFEYLYPEDEQLYDNFLLKAVNLLNPQGFKVMTSLAPKTSSDQPGLLYEAHDYQEQGTIVNRIILMTYEWGYLYGPAMPVAPLDKVEEVISYAISDIPHDKILMGVPNYGYVFNVPFVEGTAAKLITLKEGPEIAVQKGAKILFDQEALSPYFIYYDNGEERHVHFEDARSLIAKIELAKKYDLAGLSYWTIMDFFTPNWLLIDYYIEVIKVI